MKKIILSTFIFFNLFLGCTNPKNKKNTLDFSIDTKPASLFIEIMNLTMNNQIDKLLDVKIDSLLNQPVYTELTNNISLITKNKKYIGNDAYKYAFKNLNNENFIMSGDINNYWKEWWKKTDKKKLLHFINEVKSNKTDIIKQSTKYINTYLPSKIDTSQHIDVVLCFDGNRGCFTENNMLVMDLLDINNNMNSFIKTFSHELHHIYYRKWLNKQIKFKNKNKNQKILIDYQKKLILEGIAQQINFDDSLVYTNDIKELYFNKELINELANDWFNHFRKINKSKQPDKYYKELINKIWGNQAIDKLNRYYKGNKMDDALESRPTVFYYIGFHLYYDVYKNGGKEKLDYVISQPKDLLIYYNKLRKDNDFIPIIPKDIIKIWNKSFE